MARPRVKGMDYFPHDTNSLNDEKIEYLTSNFGAHGYAFYFIILERIYRTENYELDLSSEALVGVLQKKTFSDAETFQKLIDLSVEIGLFDVDKYRQEKVLTSNGIKERAAMVEEKRENSRFSYQKRVSVAETTPETTQRKGKEIKVKKSIGIAFIPPTLQDVTAYFRENRFPDELARRAFTYYAEANPPWTDAKGSPVRSWKQKMQAVWMKEENRTQTVGTNGKPVTATMSSTLSKCSICGESMSDYKLAKHEAERHPTTPMTEELRGQIKDIMNKFKA